VHDISRLIRIARIDTTYRAGIIRYVHFKHLPLCAVVASEHGGGYTQHRGFYKVTHLFLPPYSFVCLVDLLLLYESIPAQALPLPSRVYLRSLDKPGGGKGRQTAAVVPAEEIPVPVDADLFAGVYLAMRQAVCQSPAAAADVFCSVWEENVHLFCVLP
jgi:hypothetical protein